MEPCKRQRSEPESASRQEDRPDAKPSVRREVGGGSVPSAPGECAGGEPLPLWPPEESGPRGPADVPMLASENRRLAPDPPGVEDQSAEAPQLVPFLIRGDGPARGLLIVCPGGGMMFLSPKEAEVICRWVNSLGLHAALLRYRVQRRFPAALLDARRALQLVRRRAASWGVDRGRVGVLGFSAGGHVAAMLAAAWDFPRELGHEGPAADAAAGVAAEDARPDCAILCYPVITGSGDLVGAVPDGAPYRSVGRRNPGEARPLRHHGTCVVLLGDEPTTGWGAAELDRISADRWVRKAARPPPTFIMHTAEDCVVPSVHALRFAAALAGAGAAYELHVYPRGAHGLPPEGPSCGMGPTDAWREQCRQWLHGLGWL